MQHPVTYFSDYSVYKKSHGPKWIHWSSVYQPKESFRYDIDHGCLLSKFPCYGIRGRELTWFENYLFGRKQFVTFDSAISERQTVFAAVPQGSVLGLLLFVLLINDTDLELQKCKILLYADDTVFFTSDKSCETIESNLNSDRRSHQSHEMVLWQQACSKS